MITRPLVGGLVPRIGLLLTSMLLAPRPRPAPHALPPTLQHPLQHPPTRTTQALRMGGGYEGVPENATTRARVLDYRGDELLIEKLVGLTGVATYKEAFSLLKQGRVTVRGAPARAGQLVSKGEEVCLDGEPLPPCAEPVCYLLNKPRDVLSGAPGAGAREGERRKAAEGGTVLDFVPQEPRVVAAGRLDYESEGLILLTNDGSLVHVVASPAYGLRKTYHVRVRSSTHTLCPAVPSPSELRRLSEEGVVLQSGQRLVCVGARVVRDDGAGLSVVEIVLEEGRNREIRKMMASTGFQVLSLVRVAIGPIRGPISQESLLLSGAMSESEGTAHKKKRGGAGGPEQPRGARGGGGGMGWALVERGAVLEPGQACILTDEEVTSIFELASQGEGGGGGYASRVRSSDGGEGRGKSSPE